MPSAKLSSFQFRVEVSGRRFSVPLVLSLAYDQYDARSGLDFGSTTRPADAPWGIRPWLLLLMLMQSSAGEFGASSGLTTRPADAHDARDVGQGFQCL